MNYETLEKANELAKQIENLEEFLEEQKEVKTDGNNVFQIQFAIDGSKDCRIYTDYLTTQEMAEIYNLTISKIKTKLSNLQIAFNHL